MERRAVLSGFIAQDERRNLPDRRKRPTPMLSRYTLVGRRKGFRRTEEGRNAYVDRYEAGLMAAFVAIVGLSLLDALFTLLYLQRGGTELNPFMRSAIDLGVVPFVLIKCGLTFLGIAFLCLHKNFRFVKPLIGGVLGVYTALLGYHIYLAFWV